MLTGFIPLITMAMGSRKYYTKKETGKLALPNSYNLMIHIPLAKHTMAIQTTGMTVSPVISMEMA